MVVLDKIAQFFLVNGIRELLNVVLVELVVVSIELVVVVGELVSGHWGVQSISCRPYKSSACGNQRSDKVFHDLGTPLSSVSPYQAPISDQDLLLFRPSDAA